MGMIKDLWDIAKDVFDLEDKLLKQKKEKKIALANLLQHIGDVLKDTYDKLSKPIYPAGNCEQLGVLSEDLYKELVDVVGEGEAALLSNKLNQAHNVEELYHVVNTITQEELEQLDAASGRFIAVSQKLLAAGAI
ncbi:MAG TPA: hypothetical protein VNZ49_12525 [Bacteroidia bacterium]|jgi:hypothetical protein|nr:hypothetical protein [Bacteroidia bacterium]